MNLYAFELGRKRALCLAELISLLGEDNLVEKNNDTAVFQINLTDPQGLQDSLGGTIKIIKIIERTTDLKKSLEKILLEPKFDRRKIPFAINTLNFKRQRDNNTKDLLNYSKKILKSRDLNPRFINKNFANTSPAAIFKSKIIKKGIDINIIKSKSDNMIGRTVSIQNIDNYSLRDYNKPARDPKIGMLPPKLAQILINLAGPHIKSIYDPFCGTGTVLTEGMLMDLSVVGSDIDPKLIEYTERNCKWLEEKFNTTAKFKVFEKDAQKIEKNDIPSKLDAIITEGDLGPPLSSPPTEEKMREYFAELSTLHSHWLTATHAATNAKIVMCKTAYRVRDKIVHFPNFEELAHKAGYRVTQTYTYDRPDQIVIRDIAVLEKI